MCNLASKYGVRSQSELDFKDLRSFLSCLLCSLFACCTSALYHFGLWRTVILLSQTGAWTSRTETRTLSNTWILSLRSLLSHGPFNLVDKSCAKDDWSIRANLRYCLTKLVYIYMENIPKLTLDLWPTSRRTSQIWPSVYYQDSYQTIPQLDNPTWSYIWHCTCT